MFTIGANVHKNRLPADRRRFQLVSKDDEPESPRPTTPAAKIVVGRLARTRYGYVFGGRVMTTNVRLLCRFPLTFLPLFG